MELRQGIIGKVFLMVKSEVRFEVGVVGGIC